MISMSGRVWRTQPHLHNATMLGEHMGAAREALEPGGSRKAQEPHPRAFGLVL